MKTSQQPYALFMEIANIAYRRSWTSRALRAKRGWTAITRNRETDECCHFRVVMGVE